ncbi:FtsX-like permease family protein [Cellulomonas dongxiuzhuiae]|uniref:ABC3 transporter permease C-terminal domain-containing protein n=1 Tax=Cellulomonas dongxiuzhuiae TaxID=2819979 RepID=A0ABX8GM18_9CELL|nr:FtsX-like permease family protein [Cellulomonas dongxiuzhuiae]MBO3088979.1 hypothetical protein [Cellulomonas dongxiuzhuiae]MBO3096535.1 hypothetical protein [Cellulomonas dongxiuzhuiae]QWC16925.1 hypothetical protein KKR89_04680 [Cellulomonas dongxiuzhuiae]
MRWRSRVLRGRLREQGSVVAMVTAVAVAATTLVGLLAGLLHLAETQGAPAALSRLSPDDVRIEATVWVQGEDTGVVLDKARAGLAEITGDVPTSEDTWQVGSLRTLRSTGTGTGEIPQLVYLAAFAPTEDIARLVSGRWPDRATDETGAVEVNVPEIAARELGWQVGARVETRPWDGEEYATFVVVGTHEALRAGKGWTRDRLDGRGMEPYPWPGSMGLRPAVLWGPLVADPSALDGPGLVDTAYLMIEPHPADASSEALREMRQEVRNAQATFSEALDPEADGRVRTEVDGALDAITREVVVMRAGVITIGLLLATLATTVMLLAARLLAERRAAENELLAARGASPAHLRSVVVLEALTLAALTFLASPWLARAALERLTGSGDLSAAGYLVGPGLPAPVLLTCAVMAGVLAVALCVPSWHTEGSTSATAHAGLLRAGGDLSLLALGGLAMGQLIAYGSPLTGGPGGVGVDIVLVTGPALVTLAAATVALRLVTPLGRLADVVAARARSFVVPLAAWQVSRRPSIATGTVLVVVVAVASGTFSAAFLSTWRTSQLEQVDLAIGTDVRVDDLDDAPLAAEVAVTAAAGPDGHAQPVVHRSVGIGPRGNVGGVTAQLVALDASRPQDLRGRSGSTPDELLAGLADAHPATGTGAELPPETQWVVATGVLGTTPATGGDGMVDLTVESPTGLLVRSEERAVPLGEPFQVAFEVPAGGALRVVAIGAMLAPRDLPLFDPQDPKAGLVRVLQAELSVTRLGTVPRSAGISHPRVAAGAASTPVTLSAAGWSGALRQAPRVSEVEVLGGVTAEPGDGALVAVGTMRGDGRGIELATLLARTWEASGAVPAVVGKAMLDDLALRPGQDLTLNLAGTHVDAEVERFVDEIPGSPRRGSILVDQLTLARAAIEAGGPSISPDTWWIAAPDDAAVTVPASLAGTGARTSTRVDLRDEALTGPVRVAVPATMALVSGAATLLVLVGVGAVAAAAVRARRLELARLQAVGASRPGLMSGMVAESTMLVVLGAVVGLLAGYGLAGVVAPLLTMSPDGRTPVPDPLLVWGWAAQTTRSAAVVAGACAVVAVVVALGVRRTSGAALRMGDER